MIWKGVSSTVVACAWCLTVAMACGDWRSRRSTEVTLETGKFQRRVQEPWRPLDSWNRRMRSEKLSCAGLKASMVMGEGDVDSIVKGWNEEAGVAGDGMAGVGRN